MIGTKPAIGASITDQTLIATTLFADPCGSISSQTLTFTTPADVLAVSAGVVTWCRITDSDDTFCLDMDVSDNLGNGAVKIDNTEVFIGGTIKILSAAIAD